MSKRAESAVFYIEDFAGKAASADLSSRSAPALVWNGAEYARVQPGIYSAVAVRTQGPEWMRQCRRWSLIVEFELLGEAETIRVCAFYNMGDDPRRPKIGRQSRYFKAWTLANGGLPKKGQEMSPRLFIDGQIYRIEVIKAEFDSKGKPKAEAEIYSKVKDIVSVEGGLRQSEISKS